MRIRGTKGHLIDHRRRGNRSYGSFRDWWNGTGRAHRDVNCDYGEYDHTRLKHAKGSEKHHYRELILTVRSVLSDY